MITLILLSCVDSFPPRVSADGAAAGSAGWQRKGESLGDRADSSSSGASDQDQGHRPRDSHTLQGTEEVTLILINHVLIFSATEGSLEATMIFKALVHFFDFAVKIHLALSWLWPVSGRCITHGSFSLRVCQSALMPAKLIFKAEDGAMYPVIFKHGDDLRQDQLILQIISLMDKVRILFC